MEAPFRNELYYLKFTLLSMAWFFALHLAVHLVCLRKNQHYRDLSSEKRCEYRTYVISPVHAIVATLLSTIAMLYICGEGRTVFNNDACMDTTRYIHIWALLHTCGYFLVDFIFLYFVVKGNTTLDYQTYAHHLVAVTTFYQTLYFMHFMTVFGVMLLFIEISTPFLCARWFMFTHGMTDSIWYPVNALCLIITFFLARIVYLGYVVFWVGSGWVYEAYMKKEMGLYKGFVLAEMALMVILSCVLNAYWFWLMFKMIIRVISRSTQPKASAEEKVELVKNDALAMEGGHEIDCGSSTQGSNQGEIADEAQNNLDFPTPHIEEESI